MILRKTGTQHRGAAQEVPASLESESRLKLGEEGLQKTVFKLKNRNDVLKHMKNITDSIWQRCAAAFRKNYKYTES